MHTSYTIHQDFEKQVTTSTTGLPHLAEGMLKQQTRGENMTGATGTAATEQAHLFRDAPFQTWYIMATVEVDVYVCWSCVRRCWVGLEVLSGRLGGLTPLTRAGVCLCPCDWGSNEFCKKNPRTRMTPKILAVIKAYTDTNLLEMAVRKLLDATATPPLAGSSPWAVVLTRKEGTCGHAVSLCSHAARLFNHGVA